MSDISGVGDNDNWQCWLCDKPVDSDASVNSDLGPSVDSYAATRVKKGAVAVERLRAKGGREIVARCPDETDARQASEWLLDRLSRLAPDLEFSTQINPGGGQFVLALTLR